MTQKSTGRCLCGAITYETATPEALIVCHCRTCQKAHGAAFASATHVPRADFRWVTGDDVLGEFNSSPGKSRHFCTKCGTPLLSHWHDRDVLTLRVATLDEPLPLKPGAHIWTSHQAWFFDFDDSAPRHPEAPPKPK